MSVLWMATWCTCTLAYNYSLPTGNFGRPTLQASSSGKSFLWLRMVFNIGGIAYNYVSCLRDTCVEETSIIVSVSITIIVIIG